MTRKILFLLTLVLPFVIGCKGPNDSTSATESRTVQELITDMPEVEFDLPDSLKDGNGSDSASVASRASGDVTAFTVLSSQQGVKANGWYRVKEATSGNNSTSVMLLNYLKHAASQVDIETDKDIDLGVLSVPSGEDSPTGTETMDYGTIHIKQIAESEISVLWTVAIPEQGTYYIKIEIEELEGGHMAVESYMLFEMSDDPGTVIKDSYSTYNSSTGEAFSFSDSSYWSESDDAYSVTSLTQDSSGTVKLIDRWYDGPTDNQTTVAWANDDMGGIANSYNWQWTDSDGAIIQEEGLSVEFYDEDGFMVKRGWGNAELRPEYMGLDWYNEDEYTNSFNLVGDLDAKPASFTVTYQNNGDIILSDGTKDVDITGHDYWDFYWKAGVNWASGDCSYWSSEWTWDSDNNASVVTYITGQAVPDSTTYLGGDYYMNNSFPLRYLAVDKEGFTLKNEEGDTYSDSWSDSEGNEWTWSWTDYTWWLDNNDAGTVDTLDDADINVNGSLYMDTYYMWDDEADQSIEQKAYTFGTDQDEPSGLFVFTEKTLVDSVKSELETLYSASKDTFSTNPVGLFNFPDVSVFPAP